jgi:hypothetical protein
MRSYTKDLKRALPLQSYPDLVKDLETGWRTANLRGFTLDQLIARPVCFVTGEVHPEHDSEEAFIASLDKRDEEGRAYLSKYKRAPSLTSKRFLESRAFNCEWRIINAAAIERSNKREKREKAKWAAAHAAELAAMSPAELKKYCETPS